MTSTEENASNSLGISASTEDSEMYGQDDETASFEGQASLAADEDDDDDIAAEERRLLSRFRGIVYILLTFLCIFTTLGMHHRERFAKDENLMEALDHGARLVARELHVHSKLAALQSLVLTIRTETERDSNGDRKWPRVVIPQFDAQARTILDILEGDVENSTGSVSLLPIVEAEHRSEYETYTVEHAQDWVEHASFDAFDVTASYAEKVITPVPSVLEVGVARVALEQRSSPDGTVAKEFTIAPQIYDDNGVVTGDGPFAPVWQTAPVTRHTAEMVNYNVLVQFPGSLVTKMVENEVAVLTPPTRNVSSGADRGDRKNLEPSNMLLYPVRVSETTVAVLATTMKWSRALSRVLSQHTMDVVVSNSCSGKETYQLQPNGDVVYRGSGDVHLTSPSLSRSFQLIDNAKTTSHMKFDDAYCPYTVNVYPSSSMMKELNTSEPWVNSILVVILFTFVALLFYGYDYYFEKRQIALTEYASQSSAILSNLFPERVRDRLLHCNDEEIENEYNQDIAICDDPPSGGDNFHIKSFLTDGGIMNTTTHSKPIADLFPFCTVMFADIAGFTAWSSLRDASQVFTLLEAVYQAFDVIARKRGVFKVETIGDSYVAVTGLPDPQEDHAVIMAKFARDCNSRFKEVARTLELSLGPDTGDLSMRFGLNSGPVTAGVLRGEKSRFQLFGDTVNTAARMESTGERNRIQISRSTSDFLVNAGQGHWVRPRETLVHAKGKGDLQTFWLEPTSRRASTNPRSSLSSVESDGSVVVNHQHLGECAIWGTRSEISDVDSRKDKHRRLIDYNVDLLATHLKFILARRQSLEKSVRRGSQLLPPRLDSSTLSSPEGTVLEEVTEVIRLPNFNSKAFKSHIDPESVELNGEVLSQLKRYVTVIAAMYRQNPFHNWEHASHVTMSVNKLLQKVVTPGITMRRRSLQMDGMAVKKQIASDLHSYTYGLTSDPLTQFAVVFAAMIHDCDHFGVSNGQLVKEEANIAKKYKNKSVAEQNSVDLAWDLLMDSDEYGALQACIFPSDSEFKRFRQVVVNVVMATDIFDKELGELRKNRWTKAFQMDSTEPDEDHENRKATIVIEHIMQAGDVGHTMQHWHVYQKWNRRLFDELYTAFRAGRMDVDPSSFWYEGELKFFDFYIIPLAKKLKECNVFGVASDECLNYAQQNRLEWELKGEAIVAELVSSFLKRETEETPSPAENKRGTKQRFARRRSLITSGG